VEERLVILHETRREDERGQRRGSSGDADDGFAGFGFGRSGF
jgi:hypothetical protein